MAYSQGKIAVVTGAGSGIGRALAQQLNREGCALHLSDINAATLADTVSTLNTDIAPVKQKVLDVAYGGGKPIGTFMDYGNAYYKDFTGLYPYDPAKAKKLLAEAGVGKETELEMFLPQNYPPHVKAGEIYQDMLTKVGLNVKIKLVDWSTWIGDVYRQAKFDFTAIGHTGKLDPDGTLSNYGVKEKKYVRWDNPGAAALFARAAKTDGFENRKKLYDQGLELMAKEVPFMFLGSSYRRIGTRKNVSEFRMTPSLDTFDFRWTEVK